jgi:hypothetical protein
MEYVLRNTLLTLLDQPEATLADILRLFHDPGFRRMAVVRIQSPQVRDFWANEFEQYPLRLRAEVIAPIQNKVGAFVTHPVLNRILTQPRSHFSLREIMDGGQILLVNLAKGRLGEDGADQGTVVGSDIPSVPPPRSSFPHQELRRTACYLIDYGTNCTGTPPSVVAVEYPGWVLWGLHYDRASERPNPGELEGPDRAMGTLPLSLTDANEHLSNRWPSQLIAPRQSSLKETV